MSSLIVVWELIYVRLLRADVLKRELFFVENFAGIRWGGGMEI
jgi:hypothetical protein